MTTTAHPVRLTVARRRLRLALATALVIATGLAVTEFGADSVADAVKDALYAVLVYLLVAFVAPCARGGVVAATAVTACVVIESAQLTGLPAALVDAWQPFRYLLGTTFSSMDLLAYGVGITMAWAAVAAVLPVASAPAAPGSAT
jgi:Protein of unknown function (DUF2809)